MVPYGPYLLLRRLAIGGMAEVFLARHQDAAEAEQYLVLKRILPHLEDRAEFVRMFLDEARLTAHLFHSNVVQVHDFGRAEGVHYIAMEYIDGLSLRQLLSRLGVQRLPHSLSCFIVAEACAALAYAHAKTDLQGKTLGIVHRDVSPDNILLSREGAVKLADFGIAKASIHLNRTRPGQTKGKMAYMSPEQAIRGEIDHRSDLFSAGAVLYEATLGQRVFSQPNDAAVLNAMMNCTYTPPEELDPNYPSALRKIVKKALAKKAKDRFTSGEKMRRALLRLLPPGTSAALDLASYVRRFSDQEGQATPGGDRKTEIASTPGATDQHAEHEQQWKDMPTAAETPKKKKKQKARQETQLDIAGETRPYAQPDAELVNNDPDTIPERPAISMAEARAAAGLDDEDQVTNDIINPINTADTAPQLDAIEEELPPSAAHEQTVKLPNLSVDRPSTNENPTRAKRPGKMHRALEAAKNETALMVSMNSAALIRGDDDTVKAIESKSESPHDDVTAEGLPYEEDAFPSDAYRQTGNEAPKPEVIVPSPSLDASGPAPVVLEETNSGAKVKELPWKWIGIGAAILAVLITLLVVI